MASGNFLIGKNLSLEGFNQYVQPFLEEKGYSIKDKLSVPFRNYDKTILSSIVGEGDLEIEINKMLIEISQVLEQTEEKKRRGAGQNKNPIAWKHQVSEFDHLEENGGQEPVHIMKGLCETIGVYQDNNTASKLFPSIAQGYLLEGIEQKAEEVVKEIKSLLGQNLSDLAQ